MANKTVSNLKEVTTVSNSDVLLVETSTETLKVTKGNLLKEVNEELNAKSDANHTHDEYVTESELNSKGLATEMFVTNKIAEAQLGNDGGNMDLSGYATTEYVDQEVGKTNAQLSQLANKGTTVEVLERVTKEEIDRQIADGTMANLTIADNSITGEKLKDTTIPPEKLSGLKCNTKRNLLKGVNITTGCRYNNGVIETIESYSITDFIKVEPNRKLVLNKGRWVLVTIFDANKNFIREEKVNGPATNYEFTIPSNGAYVVVNLYNNDIKDTTLIDELVSDGYTIEWLNFSEKSIKSEHLDNECVSTVHLEDDCIDLTKLSEQIFEGGDSIVVEPVYQYEFERATSNFENGYVATAWFDISLYKGEFDLTVSVDVKANNENLQNFTIKAYQYATTDEIGGKGYISPTIPYNGSVQQFSNLYAETRLTKTNNILKVMFWGVGQTASLPETIQYTNIDVRLNGKKQKVNLDNLGYYGSASVPVITKLSSVGLLRTSKTSKPVVASKDWVYNQLEILREDIDSSVPQQPIQTQNRLQGKRIGAIGDSYVYGHTLGVDKTWLTKLAKRNGMTYFNYGVNGGLVSGANGVVERYANMNSDLDYIVVFGGHNDASQSVPIGEDSSTDINTFKGALNVLCQGLQTKYPKARILFMTPTHRKGNEPPYCQAMKDICYKYGIQVYDTYAKLGINIGNGDEGNAKQKEVFELVPLHLNELGNEYLSYKVESELLTL